MNSIPPDMIRSIGNHLNPDEIVNLSLSGNRYNLWNDKYFWASKLYNEYNVTGCDDPRSVYLFISKYNGYLLEGLDNACRLGDLFLVNYFVNMGANEYNDNLFVASMYNRGHIIERMIELGANDWDLAMDGAASGGNLDLVKYFVGKGATDFNYALMGAIYSNNRDVIDYMIEMGADDFQEAANQARVLQRDHLIEIYGW